jgi:hypothetical protein
VNFVGGRGGVAEVVAGLSADLGGGVGAAAGAGVAPAKVTAVHNIHQE